MSGSDGPRGLDRGIAALRWLLVSAQEDDSARAQVLPALSRCTVLVPTMTGAPDKLRFLAQPVGNAMVVFTGHDALEHAAKKLGWAQGTQSVSFRAMSARDALETAQLQGVRAVVVDAAAEHALELRYDEVSMYLSRGTAEFARDFVEPSSRGTGEHGLPQQRRSAVPTARGTGEHGLPRKASAPGATGEFSPRTGEINVSEVREEVAPPRKARDARRDDGGGMRARVERMMAESEPLSAREPSHDARPAPPRGREQATQPMAPQPLASSTTPAARKRNLAEIDDPFISSTPRQAPAAAGSSGGHARRVPSLAAPPLSREMPSSPFETSRPPSSPTDAPAAPAPASPLAQRAARFNYDRDETIPLQDISTAQAARASAERAKQHVAHERAKDVPAESEPLEMFGSADSAPAPPAQQPVVATRPIVIASAAAAQAPAPAPAAQAPAPAPARAPDAEPARGTAAMPKPAPADLGSGEPTTNPGTHVFIGPELDDAVLAAVADELRKFPEAEWACQLPDAGDTHVIGVRVDPSYLARTKSIEAAVSGAARRAGTVVQPVIVSTPAATKDARARGNMFFPWKKKK